MLCTMGTEAHVKIISLDYYLCNCNCSLTAKIICQTSFYVCNVFVDDSNVIPGRWKLLPEIFLGILPAKRTHNIFLFSGRPEYFRQFSVCWEAQTGRICLTYSDIWGSWNTLGKKCLHIRDIQAPPNKSCIRQFPPAWYFRYKLVVYNTTFCQEEGILLAKVLQ